MRAALHSGLEVPEFELSQSGQFLVVNRFDLTDSGYLGFEDFCVLNAKTAIQKYDGSYENITRRIQDFVSPENVRPALESFFKALALSCALKNGDAHLKNFGVLYDNAESAVRLAPIYDLVNTTAYKPADILALTLGGTKRWPSAKALISFARTQCHMTESHARTLLAQVAQGMRQAREEAQRHMDQHAAFQAVGTAMLAQWTQGLAHSLQTAGSSD
jgi:serine/threonine-protein kinase HipA